MKKQYTAKDQEFCFQWADHWFQLVDLIISLVRTDRIPPSPPPPAELDEIRYQKLRFWFIDHEKQFVSLWKDFYGTQEWALRPWDEDLNGIPDAIKYLENPFSFCYRPANLYHLMRECDVQSGVDLWDPSEHRSWTAFMELLQMGKRVSEFFEWICDRA